MAGGELNALGWEEKLGEGRRTAELANLDLQ
jgi:hypothetical protein